MGLETEEVFGSVFLETGKALEALCLETEEVLRSCLLGDRGTF